MTDFIPLDARLTELNRKLRDRHQQVNSRVQDGRRDWYKITDQGGGDSPAEVLIYDEISWFGIAADEFAADFRNIRASEITVRINSPGGGVFDGIAIANAIRAHPAKVTTQIDSLAASIASVIALAGDRVVMQPYSQFMIHDAMVALFCGMVGNAGELQEFIDELTHLIDRLNFQSNNIAAVYADKAGGTRDEWRDRMLAETWYTADEAVAAGLADEVLPANRNQDEPETENRVWDLSMFRYAGRDNAPSPAPRKEPVPEVDATAVGPHKTSAREGDWSRSANEKRLPEPVPLSVARRFYAAWDENRVEDGAIPKSAGNLPHHFVDEDGNPGAASINGVHAALARLNQTHGLSDEEQATVERHLRDHLPADETEDKGGRPAAEPHDEWAAQVAHLTEPASPSLGDLLANLREGM